MSEEFSSFVSGLNSPDDALGPSRCTTPSSRASPWPPSVEAQAPTGIKTPAPDAAESFDSIYLEIAEPFHHLGLAVHRITADLTKYHRMVANRQRRAKYEVYWWLHRQRTQTQDPGICSSAVLRRQSLSDCNSY
ncbi:hypothetical protein HPB50_008941 [Hyalomma asiaticum]|uniref:Uncharacterized protein n=1 Tax=Hyalomma asiaticum TaxID=266040 RepID=A0ACB7ST69_HYAAI|nr:hypothetical protein HPB50_008941 [Hyalomma asiaticum]